MSNSQLYKSKSGIKNDTEVTLKLWSNVVDDSNDESSFRNNLLLTNTQVLRLCKAYVNGSSANIKSDGDKLDIDKLKNVPSNLSISKSKVGTLDVDRLVPVPVDLSKLTDVVKNHVAKEDVSNIKIKNIEDKISDITNLATNTTVNAKMNETKKKYLTFPT